MIAGANSKRASVGVPSPNQGGQRYVSIGKASELLGVSIQSLREWAKDGRIEAFQTVGGHRRFLLSQLKQQALGVSADGSGSGSSERLVCVYVRVSSKTQENQGNLSRQTERLLNAVSEREGIEVAAIKVYRDVASSFGDRKGLNQLISDVVKGKVAKVFMENQDRLSRVPSLTRLVEHLCRENNVELVALDREEQNLDEQAQSMAELIEFVHVLSVRSQARKVAERRRKVLPAAVIEFVRTELANGRSIHDTVMRANQAGLRTEKGEPLSYRVLRRYCNRVFKKLPEVEGVNTFAEFAGECLKTSKKGKVQASAIHSAYAQWAKAKGIIPMSARRCGQYMRAQGWKHEEHCSYTWYADLEIIGYPNVFDTKGTWAKKYDNGIRPAEGEKVLYAGHKGNPLMPHLLWQRKSSRKPKAK